MAEYISMTSNRGYMGLGLGILAVIAGAFYFITLGERVEVPSAHVAKVLGENGYNQGVVTSSKFRLPRCLNYCDKLVILDASDKAKEEKMTLFMPKDKLELGMSVQITLSVDQNKYEEIFSQIAPVEYDFSTMIPWNSVYTTYAQQIIRAEAREFISQYSIGEITSNLEAINSELSDKLAKSIREKTPFVVRYIGLSDVAYPPVIVEAQVNSAKRREAITQEEANLEVSRVILNRQLEEQKLQRAIDIDKANAEYEVNVIIGKSMTPEYEKYRAFSVMDKMAESDNKVFIPIEMLNSMAGQIALGSAK